jgi:hypothetical protein
MGGMTFTGIVTDPIVAVVDTAWYDKDGQKITEEQAEADRHAGRIVYRAELHQTEGGQRIMVLNRQPRIELPPALPGPEWFGLV